MIERSQEAKLFAIMFVLLMYVQAVGLKVEANFADKRNYKLEDEIIDTQFHFGYDLSVTKRYPC